MGKFQHIELALGFESWQIWWEERLEYLDNLARILAKMKNSGMLRAQNHWNMMAYYWREQKELKVFGKQSKETREKTIHFRRCGLRDEPLGMADIVLGPPLWQLARLHRFM